MYCIKCGREVSDGELFCQSCSNQPGEKKQAPEIRQPERKPETQPSRNTQQKKPQTRKRRMNPLIIPMIALFLITAAAAVFAYQSYETMNVTKANYRVKEANLAARENELASLQEDYDEASLALETAEAAIAEQNTTITELQEQITLLEGSASQTVYDAAASQQAIERLTEEKETLSGQISELEEENDTLTQENTALEADLEEAKQETAALETELEALNEQLEEADEKADFMDSYIVFVNNDETDYYHRYDCSEFAKSNFWAYSRKLAQNYGYTACPDCGG